MTIQVPTDPRLLLEADLHPIQGTRFQPTGFPDLGAATYRLADGTEMLLVESAQSMANRLEAVCWDEGNSNLAHVLAGMPFIQVHTGGQPLTTSLHEAHRINSVYIEKSSGREEIEAKIGHDDKRPMDRPRFVRALFELDPSCLIHGVFLESISGVLRLPRALSGFIEAQGVQVVASGGVKNDRVAASTDRESDATAAEGYGNVPFHRDEYTAARITAFFNIDITQIRSYGLPDPATEFLFAFSLWKIQSLLQGALRLRTACDLDVKSVRVTRPASYTLPSLAALEQALPRLIEQLRSSGQFRREPLRAEYTEAKKGGGKSK